MAKAVTNAKDAASRRFPKAERLCRKRDIDRLFRHARRHYERGLLCLYRPLGPADAAPPPGGPAPAQVLIVVPSRKIRRATHRNRLRRQVREAYRLEKDAFYDRLIQHGLRLHVAIIVHRRQIDHFPELRKTLHRALTKLVAAAAEEQQPS